MTVTIYGKQNEEKRCREFEIHSTNGHINIEEKSSNVHTELCLSKWGKIFYDESGILDSVKGFLGSPEVAYTDGSSFFPSSKGSDLEHTTCPNHDIFFVPVLVFAIEVGIYLGYDTVLFSIHLLNNRLDSRSLCVHLLSWPLCLESIQVITPTCFLSTST